MLQHGLDCGHYYLDEAYADSIAVWGQARLRRYQRDSKRSPRLIKVTGNPEYKDLRLPNRLDTSGEYWLWMTGAHNLSKSYPLSRDMVCEGIEIFKALMDALVTTPEARLIIKPHHDSNPNLYRQYLTNRKLSDRIEILPSKVRLETLFPKASIVITEDSTSGMDAMFWGKVLVHTHFSQTRRLCLLLITAQPFQHIRKRC